MNGQRQFRWEISQQIENLTDISGYYEQGLIIKENIKFKRYLTLPSDPTLKDASQAGRALQHVQSTRLKIDEIQEKLRKRNLELLDRDNKIRKWASNEFNVIHQYLSSLRELREKISQLEDNLSHVTKILQQKFGSHAVCDFDEKRKKKQRKIQQKSKNKRKARITLVRNVRLFLAQNNFEWDVIDQVCPNKYRMKGVLKINKAEVTGGTEKDEKISKYVSYLKLIGAFEDNGVDDKVTSVTEKDVESEKDDSDEDETASDVETNEDLEKGESPSGMDTD